MRARFSHPFEDGSKMTANPYTAAGSDLASIFIGVVLASVIVANIAGLWHRETNSKCSLAISFTLIGLIVAPIVGSAKQRGIPLSQPAMAIAAVVMFSFTLTSFILGIIGMVEVIQRRRRYKKGLKRVITAQVLNISAFSLMILGAVSAFRTLPSAQPIASTPPIATIPAVPLEPAGSKAPSTGKSEIVMEDWNYRLAIPSQWRRSMADPTNPLINALLKREGMDVMAFIGCETAGIDLNIELSEVIKNLKESLKLQQKAAFATDKAENEREFEGHTLEYSANTAQGQFFVANWSTLHRGTLYRIIVTGPGRHSELIRNDLKRIRSGFSLIDPNKTIVGKSQQAAPKYDSLQFPFSVNLTGTSWTRAWQTLATEIPFAEFGVQNADGTAWFCVIPVCLDDENDELDITQLTTALSKRIDVPFPDEGVYGSRSSNAKGGFRGQVFAYEPKGLEHPKVYRVRVLRFQGFAFLLAAWADKEKVPFTDVLDEAMDCVQFHPENMRRPALEMLNDRQRLTHAIVCNDLGFALNRAGKQSEALAWYRRAADYNPHDVTIASNYVHTCWQLGQMEDAVLFVDRNADKVSAPATLRFLLADLWFDKGRRDDALAIYKKVFEGGHRDDNRFAGYLHELVNSGRADDALAAWDQYAGRDVPLVSRARAFALLSKAEHDKAIDVLVALQKASPNDWVTAQQLAETYLAADRPTECIDLCEKIAEARQGGAYNYQRKAAAEIKLKHYNESKLSLERALALEPNSEDIKQMLARVSGILGQGSNSSIKKEIAAVDLPADMLAMPKVKSDSAYLRGFSAWYLQASQAIAFRKGEELRLTERATITVHDQQGVEKFSTLEFRFDPFAEEIFVNNLVVKDASGEILAQGKVEDTYVVDDGVGETATQHKILHVPVPALKPGATLEYTVTRREPAPRRLEYREHFFARGLPVLQSVLHFEGKPDEVKWESNANVPAPRVAAQSLTWIVSEPPVYRWEPLQAPVSTFSPAVWIGDRGSEWKKEAADYLEQIKERLAIDTSVRDQALKLVEGINDRGAKISAISRFVQRELTYKAIAFGRRARLPNAAAQTLRNKYGDCKDHTLLLTQLLDAVGIPARMALVNSGGKLREGLPSLDQFNHVIAYLPEPGAAQFIDSTSKLQDLRTSPPAHLAKQSVLVLDDVDSRLVTLPELPPDSSTITGRREVTFVNEKDADVSESLILTGAASMPIRGALQAIEPAHRNRQLLATMNDKSPSLDLRDATIENIDDPQQPLVLKIHYVIRNQLRSTGSQLVGTLPAVWERVFFTATPVEHRYTPFCINIPTRFSSEVSIVPPPNWRAEPLTSQTAKTDFGSVQSSVESTGSRFKLTATIAHKPGQFEASRYSDYCEAMNGALALVEQPIVFKKRP
jgi:tetratricopeptide (TPR) repeat protein